MLISIGFLDFPVVKSWYPRTMIWADLLIVRAGTAGSMAGSCLTGSATGSATISGTGGSTAAAGGGAGLMRSQAIPNRAANSTVGRIRKLGRRRGIFNIRKTQGGNQKADPTCPGGDCNAPLAVDFPQADG